MEDDEHVTTTIGGLADPLKLENCGTLLINNIARLKDHYDKWCVRHGLGKGRAWAFIKNNPPANTMHELWNAEKHGSGYSLQVHGEEIVLGGKPVDLLFDTQTMAATVRGGAFVRLRATILDSDGVAVGDFETTCASAVDAWLQELTAAGVKL